ncbi:MAG: hypothetical protein AAF409_14700 [Pseudomonadota bacterium]
MGELFAIATIAFLVFFFGQLVRWVRTPTAPRDRATNARIETAVVALGAASIVDAVASDGGADGGGGDG